MELGAQVTAGVVMFVLAAVANAPKKTVELELDTWIKWDTYPNDVPFKLEEPISGIGNGEYKLAAILGTKPLGQNVPYDLDLCIKDLCSRGEGIRVAGCRARSIANAAEEKRATGARKGTSSLSSRDPLLGGRLLPVS
jgi:hypothetical protein